MEDPSKLRQTGNESQTVIMKCHSIVLGASYFYPYLCQIYNGSYHLA
jgi:hypothetical protein